MATYLALLDGGKREQAVGVERLGPGLYQVRIGDRAYRVDAFPHDAATLSLLVDAESYSVTVDPRPGHLAVRVRGSLFPIEILDERRQRLRRGPSRLRPAGRQELTAPLAARVVKVLARVGEAVAEGQGLLVVEILGMENELASPKGGKLTELAVAAGQEVERGARLAVVE